MVTEDGGSNGGDDDVGDLFPKGGDDGGDWSQIGGGDEGDQFQKGGGDGSDWNQRNDGDNDDWSQRGGDVHKRLILSVLLIKRLSETTWQAAAAPRHISRAFRKFKSFVRGQHFREKKKFFYNFDKTAQHFSKKIFYCFILLLLLILIIKY